MSVQATTRARLTPYLPRLTLQWLRDDPGALHRAVDGSVVFVDISGFTKLSEKLAKLGRVGAEEMADAINACFTDLLRVAYAEDGGLLKFGGDALLLLFSGVEQQEAAARAARAAIGMRRRLREIGTLETGGGKVTLRMSVGVHSGTFDFFLVGGSHRELIVTGPAATTVVEMEGTATAGEVVVSNALAELLPSSCVGEPKGPGRLLRSAPGSPPESVGTPPDVPEDLLERCIPVATREELLAGGSEPEHRQVTVAFLHYDGTDEFLATDGPDLLAFELDHLVRDTQEAVDDAQVCFLGSDVDADGGKLILTAGAPRSVGEDEERMLIALRRIADGDRRLPVRIGVNRGGVFAGDIGPFYRRTYTVMGDTVNLAARLMAKAPPGEIYATGSVLDLSSTGFETTELEPFMVKGKAKPVQAWSLGKPVGSREREAVPSERFPLIGRDAEMALLDEALRRAANGAGSLIEIVGEPGIGKTRLLEELRERAADSVLLRATCEAYTSSTPYYAWRDVCRQMIEVPWDAPDGIVLERLADIAKAQDPDLLPWLPLLAMPFDVEAPSTPEVRDLAPEFRRSKLHEVMRTFLAGRLAAFTVFEFEDAHLMDPASAELLAAICQDVAGAPWLVVVSRRDGDRGFAAVEDACLVHLEPAPLAEADARALAEAATERDPLAPQIIERIAERSGGNPQFLLALVDAAAGLDGAELPESVESAATVRIDRLGSHDRTIMRRAAVLGVSFHRRLVAELLDDETQVDDSVWRRLEEFFVREGEDSVRFRSAVVRDAAYEGLPFRTRRLLHAKAAQRIEDEAGAEVEEFSGVLSLHYSRAGDHGKAWNYALSAADRAASFYANIEAAELYQRAIDAGKRSKVQLGELLRAAESRAQVLYKAGLYTDAARAFEDARRYSAHDSVARARLMLWRSQVEENIGRVPLALRWASIGRRELRNAEGPDAKRQEAELTARYAAALQAAGRNRDAARWAERAVAEAEASTATKALGDAHNILGNAFAMMGRPEAGGQWREALRRYEEIGELRLCAAVLVNLGALAYWEGRWDEALKLYEESRESYMRVGDPVTARLASINIAELLIGRGIFDEAEAILLDAQRVLRAAGEHYFLGLSLAYLGRVAAATERFDEALDLFERAKEEFGSLGAKGDLIEVGAREAECQLLMGDGWRALGTASEALGEVAGEGDLSVLEALLYRVHGYALMQVGDLFGAEESLQRSLESARTREADYDVAMTLHALGQLALMRGEPSADFETESATLLEELGIRSVPQAPVQALEP
jgi:class 3 adenylate cyclase/tetratricopeptide (TPR) repeat protein